METLQVESNSGIRGILLSLALAISGLLNWQLVVIFSYSSTIKQDNKNELDRQMINLSIKKK